MLENLVLGALDTNCYITELESGRALIIDPAFEERRIIEKLEALNLSPQAVFLTHGHFDHLAALPALLEFYRSKGIELEVIVHKNDAIFLGQEAYKNHCKTFAAAAGGDSSFIDEFWVDLPAPTRLVEDGDKIERFEVLHLPGHSAGSTGLFDEKAAVLFSGDTLFRSGVGRTDLPESDHELLEKSLARLFCLPPETEVYPGHGAKTTIEREKSAFVF